MSGSERVESSSYHEGAMVALLRVVFQDPEILYGDERVEQLARALNRLEVENVWVHNVLYFCFGLYDDIKYSPSHFCEAFEIERARFDRWRAAGVRYIGDVFRLDLYEETPAESEI